MGGPGSGNWYRSLGSKSTVEGSLTVAVRDIRNRLHHGSSGTFSWTWRGGHTSSIGYFVTRTFDVPTVTLHYRWGGKEVVRVPVRMTTTPTQFGGRRWWFTCPLSVRGVPCNRRVGKLHLPSGARLFGCRRCHNLTYRSCQESHQAERVFGRLLGCDAETARLIGSRWGRKGR